MQTILFNILLLLTVIWLLVGILFLWQQLHIVRQKVEEVCGKKNKQKQRYFCSGKIWGTQLMDCIFDITLQFPILYYTIKNKSLLYN